jgi:hypothetical protein
VSVSFLPAAVQAATGATVTVSIQVDNVANLSSISPLRIKYDPELLRLEDIAPGDLLSRAGVNPSSVKDIRNDAGEASLTVTRPPNAAAVSGSGTIAVLTFTATGNGEAPLTISEVSLKDAQNAPLAATATSLGVQIQ